MEYNTKGTDKNSESLAQTCEVVSLGPITSFELMCDKLPLFLYTANLILKDRLILAKSYKQQMKGNKGNGRPAIGKGVARERG